MASRWRTLWKITVALAVIQTCAAQQNSPRAAMMSITNEIVMNVSTALRDAGGYDIMAMSLQISADEILPATPSTLFALSDAALKNVSLPPWLMMDLLHYHTSKQCLPSASLRQLQPGTCIPTLLNGKNLIITTSAGKNHSVALNGVGVARPDIYTHEALVVHGVRKPFFRFRRNTTLQNLRLAPCSLNSQPFEQAAAPVRGGDDGNGTKATTAGWTSVSWPEVEAALRASGFVSFAVALRLQETDLTGMSNSDAGTGNEVTVFAPPDEAFAYVTAPSPALGAIVRRHIVPKRLRFGDLVRLPVGFKIGTLVPGRYMEITGAFDAFHPLFINNVAVVRPDVYGTDDFVVHGISRPFNLFNSTGSGN